MEVKFQFVTPRFRPFGERMIAKINIVQDAIRRADALSSRGSVSSSIMDSVQLPDGLDEAEIF